MCYLDPMVKVSPDLINKKQNNISVFKWFINIVWII